MNRLQNVHPDYLLTIVRTPRGWTPTHIEDVPHGGKVVSIDVVASYEEAFDDLIRCNTTAMNQRMQRWAIIQCLHA